MPADIDEDFRLNSGITPPTREIRKKKFKKRKRDINLKDAENEVLKTMARGRDFDQESKCFSVLLIYLKETNIN